MKKLIYICLPLILILVACEREEETIVFEPVLIPGFEVTLENAMELTSNAFNQQGLPIENEYVDSRELIAILEELEIELPELPELETTFVLELTSYEFTHEFEQAYENEGRPALSIDVVSEGEVGYLDWGTLNNGAITFSESTLFFEDQLFTHSGVFNFMIYQLITDEATSYENWALSDHRINITVTIIEDEESESLIADVIVEEEPIFTNIFTYDISEAVSDATRRRWEYHVRQAYEEGYEYVLNENDEYERVAIYVSAPAEETQTAPDDVPPQVSATPPRNSGIPENYATQISHAEGMSYLALVNRHFRLPSNFSPGDLSVVNALNTYGNTNQWIQMRATAARAMEAMLDTAYAEGGHVIIIVSGYRSYATQTSVHNNHIANRGETEARRVSARPGHSEHQLGLAMDLSTFGLGGQLSSQFSSTPEGNWIKHNAHRFGFIVRYPANREPDTGFIYEPWHLRYIGVEAATQMHGTGWILEEFLGN